jgi:hypothetical protein
MSWRCTGRSAAHRDGAKPLSRNRLLDGLSTFSKIYVQGLPLPRAIKQDGIGDRSNLAILVHRTSVILTFLCNGPADDGLSQLLI